MRNQHTHASKDKTRAIQTAQTKMQFNHQSAINYKMHSLFPAPSQESLAMELEVLAVVGRVSNIFNATSSRSSETAILMYMN